MENITVLISSFLGRGQRWRLVALVALFFVAGCTVELYPPAQEVNNLPDGGKVDVLPDTIPRAFSFGPRIYWSQIIASDSAYSIAVTDANNKGRWLDSLRWVPSGPFVTVNGDTLSTRAYARDNSGVTGDNQVLTYNGSGSLTIESGNTVDMSDLLDNTDDQTIDTFSLSANILSLSIESDGEAAKTVDLSGYLDNTDAQTIDTLTLQGDTILQMSLSGDGAPVKELDLSALRSVVDSTRLTQDSILVYYQDGAEVGRDTIAGTGGGGADNLGNHIMTQNLQTNGNWISGDGDNEGVYINSSGNVGIGTSTITEKLHIPARIKVNNGILDMVGSDIYLGLNAGNSQLTNFSNFFAGYRAGSTVNSFYNTMIGSDAGRLNTGNRNTFLGSFAGENSTTSESVVIGSTAGRNSAPGSSVVIGSEAGISATGSRNVIIGFRAGSVNAASGNVFLGAFAGAANTSGFNNLFVGDRAGRAVTTGSNNTVIGTGNATNLITGSTNTIIGSSNARDLTSGQYNTIIGTLSGTKFQGASNLLLGYQSLFNDTLSNSSIVIGNGAAANSYNTTNSVFLGNSAGPSIAKNVSSKLYISSTSGSPTIYGDLAAKNIGIGQETADYVLDMGSRTGAVRLPVGTTAQNPTGATGLLRYNSDSTAFTGYYNAQWNRLVDLPYLQDNFWNTDGTDIWNSNSGNVGINTATPSAELEVNGGVKITGSATEQFKMEDASGRQWNWGVGNGLGGQARMQYYIGGNLRASMALTNGFNFDSYGSSGIVFDHPNSSSSDPVVINLRNRVGIGYNPSGYSDHLMIKENNIGNADADYISLLSETGNEVAVWADGGEIGIGVTTPTALIHLKAGTATANTAPLKFTSGTNLTTPEAGAMEWDGTNLYITQTTGPTRKTIAYVDTDDGSASDTTDGSGDITVSHTLGSASITVTATATGTTFYHVQAHTKTSTTFKIRFFDAAGAAVTATAVTADWIAKLQ